jgi:hypothetical protein
VLFLGDKPFAECRCVKSRSVFARPGVIGSLVHPVLSKTESSEDEDTSDPGDMLRTPTDQSHHHYIYDVIAGVDGANGVVGDVDVGRSVTDKSLLRWKIISERKMKK